MHTLLGLGQLTRKFENPVANGTMRDRSKLWEVRCEHFAERLHIEIILAGIRAQLFQNADYIAQHNFVYVTG